MLKTDRALQSLSLAKDANGYEEWGEGGSFSRNGFMKG
jgi:hypothetical protein